MAVKQYNRNLAAPKAVSEIVFRCLLFVVFAFAVVNSIQSSCSHHVMPVMFAYDSNYYRETCAYIISFWSNFWRSIQCGHLLFDWKQTARLLDFTVHIKRDGPVVPIVFSSLAIATGNSMTADDHFFVALVQSLMYGLTAVLATMTALNLTRNKLSAIIGGLLFLSYAPFCLATGRFLNETIAILLSVCVVYLCSSLPSNCFRSVLLGAAAACLVMIKAALLPAAILPIICVFSASRFVSLRHRLKIFGGVLSGAMCLILPWSAFMFGATGKFVPTADRDPQLNFLLGLDIETMGVPVIYKGPFFQTCFTYNEPLASALGAILARPIDYVKFFVWKLQADLNFPWNDFQQSFFCLSPVTQCYWHWCLLILGLLGAVIICLKFPTPSDKTYLPQLSCLTFAAGHVVWVLVATNNRYLVTALPAIILLAAFAIHKLIVEPVFSKFNNSLMNRTTFAIDLSRCVVVSALILSAWVATFIALSPDSRERKIELQPESVLTRVIDLSGKPAFFQAIKKSRFNAGYLIVDSGATASGLKASINGHHLQGEFCPLYRFADTEYARIARSEIDNAVIRSNLAGPESIRSWKALALPVELLDTDKLVIKLTQKSSATDLFSDASMSERRLPSLFLFSDEKFWRDPFKLDGRPDDPVLAANLPDSYTMTLKTRAVSLSCKPRIRLLLTNLAPGAPATMPALAPITLDFPSSSFLLRPFEQDVTVGREPKQRLAVKQCSVQAPIVKVDVTGEARSLSGHSVGGIKITVDFNDKTGAVAPAESSIVCNRKWKPFTISGTLPSKTSDCKITRVVLELLPADWHRSEAYSDLNEGITQFRNLRLRITPLQLPQSTFEQKIVL